MDYSRRDVALLIPALAAAQSSAQSKTLPSKTFRFEEPMARGNGPLHSRAILKGETHTGYPIDLHGSELDAGQAPHAPHRHAHEEILLIRIGTLDVTIGGQTTRLGPGSAAYFASNEEHGWRNTGTTAAQYFVLALGADG